MNCVWTCLSTRLCCLLQSIFLVTSWIIFHSNQLGSREPWAVVIHHGSQAFFLYPIYDVLYLFSVTVYILLDNLLVICMFWYDSEAFWVYSFLHVFVPVCYSKTTSEVSGFWRHWEKYSIGIVGPTHLFLLIFVLYDAQVWKCSPFILRCKKATSFVISCLFGVLDEFWVWLSMVLVEIRRLQIFFFATVHSLGSSFLVGAESPHFQLCLWYSFVNLVITVLCGALLMAVSRKLLFLICRV